MDTYTIYLASPLDIRSLDLQREAAETTHPTQAARILVEGSSTWAEAVHIPHLSRCGIAWGGYSAWYDAESIDEACAEYFGAEAAETLPPTQAALPDVVPLDIVQGLVAAAQPRSTQVRRVEPAAVEHAHSAVTAALTWAAARGIARERLSLELHGGGVPTSYRYHAEGTWVVWRGGAAPNTGIDRSDQQWWAYRGAAPRRPHGRGWLLRLQVKDPKKTLQDTEFCGHVGTRSKGVLTFILDQV